MDGAVDKISLEISSNASAAKSDLESLADAVRKLKSSGIDTAASSMSTLSKSISELTSSNVADAKDKITSIADAISKLKGAKISPSIGANIKSLASSLGELGGVDFGSSAASIGAVGESLSKFNGVKISSTIGKNMQAISYAIRTFDDSSISMLDKFASSMGKLQGVDFKGAASAIRASGNYQSDEAKKAMAIKGASVSDVKADTASKRSTFNVSEKNESGLSDEGSKIADRITNANNALKEMRDNLKAVAASESATSAQIRQADNEVKKQTSLVNSLNTNLNATEKSANKASSGINTFSLNLHTALSNIKSVYSAVNSVANKLMSFVMLSSQYTENMNLAETAMGTSFFQSEYEYAMEVQDKLGIDAAEWIRYEGVFSTLTKGMGAAAEESELMSRNLTQLGYDLASYYNLDVEESMLKLQSGIAGELEPLRRIGYDLSVARMQLDATEMGIEENINAMSQADKVLMRYYEIMTQVTWAQGDMARTINQPANQLRVLSNQVTLCARSFGSLFIPALNAILPYIIAFVNVVTTAIQTIGNLLGLNMTFSVDWSSVNTGGISSVSDDADDATDSLGGASSAAKEFKKQLMGFDQINNITPQTDSSGGSGGSSGGGGGEGVDISGLGYDFLAGLVETNINSIKETMLGLLPVFAAVGAAFASALSFVGVQKLIEKFKNLESTLPNCTKGVKSFMAEMAGISAIAAGVTLMGFGLFDIFNSLKEGSKIALSAILEVCGGLALIGVGIAALILAVTGVFSWIPIVIGIAMAAITAIAAAIYNNWDAICSFFAGLPQWFDDNVCKPIARFFTDLWSAITIMADGLWTFVCDLFSAASSWVYNTIVAPITTFLDVMWGTIRNGFAGLWNGIKSIAGTIAAWVDNNIVVPIGSFFVHLWDGLLIGASAIWESIKSVFGQVGQFFYDVFSSAWQGVCDVFSPLGDIFVAIQDAITSTFVSLVNGLISGLNYVISTPLNAINDVLSGIRNFEILGAYPFSWIGSIYVPQIPYLATGGQVDTGQMFIARENGIPEMVGTMGGKATVANNEQIVAGISAGVANANREECDLLREQNNLLMAILEKELCVSIDGASVARSINKASRVQGRQLITA